MSFKAELITLLDNYEMGNVSGLPSYILANYIIDCINTFDNTIAEIELPEIPRDSDEPLTEAKVRKIIAEVIQELPPPITYYPPPQTSFSALYAAPEPYDNAVVALYAVSTPGDFKWQGTITKTTCSSDKDKK